MDKFLNMTIAEWEESMHDEPIQNLIKFYNKSLKEDKTKDKIWIKLIGRHLKRIGALKVIGLEIKYGNTSMQQDK